MLQALKHLIFSNEVVSDVKKFKIWTHTKAIAVYQIFINKVTSYSIKLELLGVLELEQAIHFLIVLAYQS